MLLKKKRGQRALYTTAELLIGALLLGLFVYRAVDLGTNAGEQKTYLANDLALTADALHAITGNIVYDYRENVQPYVFDIGDGIVRVATPAAIPSWYAGRYANKREHPIARYLTTPPIISFSKAGSDITIATERQTLGRTACPDADTRATFDELDIVIDPGQSRNDPGEQFLEFSEYIITRRIAEALTSICANCRILEQGSIEERRAGIADADLVVSIHIGGFENANGVRAVYSVDNARGAKLACIIANAIVRLEFLGQARMDPIDVSRLNENDARRILSPDVPSVQFVIGNIEAPTPLADAEGIVRIATKIFEGLQEYASGEPAPLVEQDIFTIPPSCQNPRSGVLHGREYEVTGDVIHAAESVAREYGIPAGALVAIAIHESGLDLDGTLGKPCPPENGREDFRPGLIVRRLFISDEAGRLEDGCIAPQENGDDRLVRAYEARTVGEACEEHACVWKRTLTGITCDNDQRYRNVPAYQCLAAYDTIRVAFEDWVRGFERLHRTAGCGDMPTALAGFINHVACVLYENDGQWSREVNEIIASHCLGMVST